MPENCPFDITPYAKSEIITKPNIINLNYTNQDFWSMKTRLVDYIKQYFEDEFNDFVESDLAIMLMENMAFIGDTLSFKIDQIANEVFIDTVTELENAFRLSKLIGFQPQPPIAARSLWTALINNPILTDITILAPVRIDVQSGQDAIFIELFPADADNNPLFDQDIIMPAGKVVNASIVGLEGRTFEQLQEGNAEVGQTIPLEEGPVIWDSVRVDVDGVRWTHVEYFTDSQPRREFRVEFDSNYNGFVIFGNNRAGIIPSTGSQILITYRVGGGTAGNITTGSVNTQIVVDVPGFEFSIPVSFRNYTKGEFGYNGDTIEDIRRKLPAWNRLQYRAVTGLDYKTLADQFTTAYQGQIGKSTAVLRNYGCAGNIVDIYVLARLGTDGLEEAKDELKTALEQEINDVKMFTDYICIRNGVIIFVDVTIDIVLDKFYRKFEDELREKIRRRTDKFFALNNWEFDKELRDTDLIQELADIREVKRFDITFVTNDEDNSGQIVTTKFNEIIRPDTIEVSFNYE